MFLYFYGISIKLFREVLPRLESCQENQNALVDLFSLASPQLKSLYVTYCKGTHRSKDIYREYLEYLQVIHL